MNNNLLTEKEAYMCMINFLDDLYRRTKSDYLGGILGDMEINKFDDMPMDPAFWNDWLRAVKKTRDNI